MDVKLTLVFIVLMVFAAQDLVQAEFGYNHVFPKKEDLKRLGLKCIPGRTVIRIKEKPVEPDALGSSYYDDYEEYVDGRRSHMKFETNDDSCQMCVCSVEGTDEYCSKRPAANVNECIRMSVLMDQFHQSKPFEHQRTLSYMIRRDYIWHDDEIPYDAKAKCRRAHSYYTNNKNAQGTDIEGPDGRPKDLIGYDDTNSCFYCVCTVDGKEASCLAKKPMICKYFMRLKANPNRMSRDRYRIMFGQDMPALFRQLSHRMRRTMDDGMYEYIETGGDSLCCGHSDGHRRQIHHQVRNKIKLLRKKVNKENLMSGAPGGDYVDFIVNNDK